MVQHVIEQYYCGFSMVLDLEGGTGWKCIIGDQEFKFPTLQAAEAAVREILKGSDVIIKKYGGVSVRKVGKHQGTKAVDEKEFEEIEKKARE